MSLTIPPTFMHDFARSAHRLLQRPPPQKQFPSSLFWGSLSGLLFLLATPLLGVEIRWRFELVAGQPGKLVWDNDPTRAYDLVESGDLVTWTRVPGYPKAVTGAVVDHVLPDHAQGFFAISQFVPECSQPPVVTGSALPGNTMAVAGGTWNAGGVIRQWCVAGALVAGATGSSYVVALADAGKDVTCRETLAGITAESDPVRVPTAITRLVCLGTSITDNTSLGFSDPARKSTLLGGPGAVAQVILRRNFELAPRQNSYANDLDHGYAGASSLVLLQGGLAAHPGLVPMDDAAATGADAISIEAGANDVGSLEADVVAERVVALWDRAMPHFERVFAWTILPQGAAMAGSRDRIVAANARLKAAAAVRPKVVIFDAWAAIPKDENGYAAVAYMVDGVHPNPQGGAALGVALAEVLLPYCFGPAAALPAANSPLWITPNPLWAGSNSRPTGWSDYGAHGKTYQAVTDPDGTQWQRFGITPVNGGTVCAPFNMVTAGFAPGQIVRASAVVRPVAEAWPVTNFGISCRIFGSDPGARGDAKCLGYHTSTNATGIAPVKGVYLTETFVVPQGAQQLYILFELYGLGPIEFDVRQAGVFRVE